MLANIGYLYVLKSTATNIRRICGSMSHAGVLKVLEGTKKRPLIRAKLHFAIFLMLRELALRIIEKGEKII